MALTVPQALVISVDFTKYSQVGYGISLNASNKKNCNWKKIKTIWMILDIENCPLSMLFSSKVIVYKSRREVSSVEKYFDCEYLS